ncbi:MAG: ribokinase [Solirubrobacteraceae bacterium]
MRAAAVLVVGSVNVDLVATVPALPGPGETVVGPGVERHDGGKGANMAVAAARLGAATAFVGAVGDDDLGAGAIAGLRNEGVDTGAVLTLPGVPTGAALIVVDAAGENQIAVGAGANHALTAAHVRAALAERAAGAGCIAVGSEVPDDCVVAAVRAAREAGTACVLNPAPARPALLDAVALGPVLTPNAGEAVLLARAAGAEPAGPEQAAAALVAHGGAPVLVTLGSDGALLVAPGAAPVRIAAPAVDAVDTTGAGDAFTGAVAARLAAGDDLEAAARYAVTAAALSVTRPGARGGMPAAADVTRAGGPAPGRST